MDFSDTTNKDGIIQGIERTLFGDDGDARISGNTTLLAYFTNDVNMALDRVFSIIFDADGTNQLDDPNHVDLPIVRYDLVASQRAYPLTQDENSNDILEIFRVAVDDGSGKFSEIKPVDQQSQKNMNSFFDGQLTEGTPTRYDKTGNVIFLDPIPSVNVTNGLKIFYSRPASYFATSDTTKSPGIARIFHEYLILRPSWMYAFRNSLSNATDIRDEMLRMEQEIRDYYGLRSRDERPRLAIANESTR